MSEVSDKWAIFEVSPGLVRIEFYDPKGKQVLVCSTFDKPAIEEFAAALNAMVRSL